MKTRLAIFLSLIFCVGIVHAANMVLERAILPSPGGTQVTRTILTHAGGTSFVITGDETDTSWVAHLWNDTSVLFTTASGGDSVNLEIIFYGGHTVPLASDITKIDYTTFVFTPQDTITITSATNTGYKISTKLTNNPYYFFTATGVTGLNGKNTILTGTTTRERLYNIDDNMLESAFGDSADAWFDRYPTAGKSIGLTAITEMADTTGFTGIRVFTFTGDTLYIYKADHTVVVLGALGE